MASRQCAHGPTRAMRSSQIRTISPVRLRLSYDRWLWIHISMSWNFVPKWQTYLFQAEIDAALQKLSLKIREFSTHSRENVSAHVLEWINRSDPRYRRVGHSSIWISKFYIIVIDQTLFDCIFCERAWRTATLSMAQRSSTSEYPSAVADKSRRRWRLPAGRIMSTFVKLVICSAYRLQWAEPTRCVLTFKSRTISSWRRFHGLAAPKRFPSI